MSFTINFPNYCVSQVMQHDQGTSEYFSKLNRYSHHSVCEHQETCSLVPSWLLIRHKLCQEFPYCSTIYFCEHLVVFHDPCQQETLYKRSSCVHFNTRIYMQ